MELLQPRTDAGAITQWIVVLIGVPVAALFLHMRVHPAVARFVLGIGALLLAWFAVRAFH